MDVHMHSTGVPAEGACKDEVETKERHCDRAREEGPVYGATGKRPD